MGYAATGRIRTAAAPTARYWYHDRLDWWEYLGGIPAPPVIVLEDMDKRAGIGALLGEIHAHIGRALGCIGYVTNGAVRDLPGIERTGFHLFARGVSVSHAYAHVADFGGPVEAGGLRVNPGDLLHGDATIAHSSTACYQNSNRRRALDRAARSQAAGRGKSQKG